MAALIGILVLGAIVLTALKFIKTKAPARTASVQGKPILTNNEREFFHRLQRALPDYHVFPQVAVNALLEVVGVPKRSSAYHASRNRFAQKHVDFVICERETLTVKAIVELDDKTHRSKMEDDRKRDDLFEQGGYPVLRFYLRQKSVEAELAKLFPVTSSDVPQLPPVSIADDGRF